MWEFCSLDASPKKVLSGVTPQLNPINVDFLSMTVAADPKS